MALIECRECNKQVSDKATTCPHCGAPVEHPTTEAVEKQPEQADKPKRAEKEQWKYRKPLLTIVSLVILAVVIVIFMRVRSGSSLRGAVTGPETIISEKISLKEGQAMSYSFTVPSQRRVEVEVEARPKAVNVMLMTESDWKKYKKAKGALFGGKYTYRRALSSKSILKMKESDILPAGNWKIVVERPSESLLFGDDTTAKVKITGH